MPYTNNISSVLIDRKRRGREKKEGEERRGWKGRGNGERMGGERMGGEGTREETNGGERDWKKGEERRETS